MGPCGLPKVLEDAAILALVGSLLQILVRHLESCLCAMHGKMDAIRGREILIIDSGNAIQRRGIRKIAQHGRIEVMICAAAKGAHRERAALPPIRPGEETASG